MVIRLAAPGDHAAIDSIVRAAFGRADEAVLVDRLRADEDTLFELVAVEQGEVAGHVLYSRLWVDRYDLYASLGPLAVDPAQHRRGLGSALVRASLEIAREFGCHGVLLLGAPAYYGRFGFSSSATAQVQGPFSGRTAFQALALEDDAFVSPMTIAYPDAFASAPSEPRRGGS